MTKAIRGKDIPDFAEIERLVRTSIGPVLAAHGLEGPEVVATPPELAVAYRSPIRNVTVFCEYGCAPWVKMETRNPNGRWKGTSLDRIIASRGHVLCVTRPKYGEATDDVVRGLLAEYANALEVYLAES